MKHKNWIAISLLLVAGLILAGCGAVATDQSGTINASGVVEAVEVGVASQVSGKVAEVYVQEGQRVSAGDQLLLLENDTLQAQYDQAQAAYDAAEAGLVTANAALASAEAGVDAAKVGVEAANTQYDMALQAARLQDLPAREDAWNQDIPTEFDLPGWYFEKSEEVDAIQQEIAAAKDDLEIERQNLADVLEDVSNADIISAEQRLLEAQVAFEIAKDLEARQIEANGREAISDYVESLVDTAEAELDSAQAAYDNLLSDVGAEDVLEARGRVAVAQERYQLALIKLYQTQTGDDSLEVTMAFLGVSQAEAAQRQAEAAQKQAEAGVTQAEKAVAQAQASLDLVQVQIDELLVSSETDGVVLTATAEKGELVQAGVTVMTIGKVDHLTITVYVAEDQYGQINLGDNVEIQVDSFADQVFSGEVTRIADQAEYTPRNVQTEEDRRTTVFAIEVSVLEGLDKLKPGMPADVTFTK